MPETLDDFLMTRPPTADRPLLGQTILVVEDSRFACEALRMICQRSGARIRRADSLRSAGRHLRTYRPGIVLVDLGLPDGSGLDLIRRLAAMRPCPAIVIAMSGDDSKTAEALAAGARSFLAKPITSVSAFQSAILAQLPPDARPAAIRPAPSDIVSPDRIALRDDLSLAAELLTDAPGRATPAYLATFLLGVAKAAADNPMADAAARLKRLSDTDRDTGPVLAALRDMVADRLSGEQTV